MMIVKGKRHKSRATGSALAILGGRFVHRQAVSSPNHSPEMRLNLRRILSRNVPQFEGYFSLQKESNVTFSSELLQWHTNFVPVA